MPAGDALDRRAASCRRRWPGRRVALEVDVLAEAGQRRGVAADVERRLDPVAGHRALGVVAGEQRAGREAPAAAARASMHDGADAADVRRAAALHGGARPAGADRQPAEGQRRRRPTPCSSSDCGWRTPSRMAPTRTSGHAERRAAARPARRGGRAGGPARRPTSPASSPTSHGRTSSGPSPSTGGSVVSRSFQPKIAWSATRAERRRRRAATAVSPSERRQSGPPSRKKTTSADHDRGDRPASRRRGSGG